MSTKVAILMGSTSDWPAIKPATEILDSLKISYEVKVLSAHRTPKQLLEYLDEKTPEKWYLKEMYCTSKHAEYAGPGELGLTRGKITRKY